MNTKMKALVTCLALLFGSQNSSAETIDLTGLGYVQYGDALSYSLAVANYQFNTSKYTIQSSPGQIDSLTVIGTGSSGNPVVNNFTGMDNAYATPNSSGVTYWTPSPTTYQGTLGTVLNNGGYTWDASLFSLKTFLGGSDMVVFMNNNQEKSPTGGAAAASESLAAWARIWITNSTNEQIGDSFYLSNMGGAYNLVSMGGGGKFLGDPTTFTGTNTDPLGGTGSSTDFVLSGGKICVATGGSLTVPVPIPCGSDPALVGGTTISGAIDHNLGADTAAYALVFPELNALMNSLFGLSDAALGGYTLHADVRLGCINEATGSADIWIGCDGYNGWGTALNNGFEQMFIGTAIIPNKTPEPGSLALIGLGFGLIGLVVRRRNAS